MKKHVSSGAATHSIGQQSLVAASFPLLVNLSPTCSACTSEDSTVSVLYS